MKKLRQDGLISWRAHSLTIQIGASEAAMPLLEKAGIKGDEGVTDLGKDFVEAAGQRFWDREPQVRMLA